MKDVIPGDDGDMETLRGVQLVLGIILFLWFAVFLLILMAGIISLGKIPKRGMIIDPAALGLGFLSFLNLVFGFLGFLSFLPWLIITAILFMDYPKGAVNKWAVVFFFIGTGGFFLFRVGFPEVFDWVMD